MMEKSSIFKILKINNPHSNDLKQQKNKVSKHFLFQDKLCKLNLRPIRFKMQYKEFLYLKMIMKSMNLKINL